MLELIQWLIVIVKIAPWVVMGCSAVAALSPTPVDDGIVKKMYMVLDWFALNIGRAKDK